jgi:hypothetical protein
MTPTPRIQGLRPQSHHGRSRTRTRTRTRTRG